MRALAAALFCILLAGCGAPSPSATPVPVPTTTLVAASATPTATPPVDRGPAPSCAAADVALSFGTWGYAAGTSAVDVHLTLRGPTSCWVATRPGLAILDAAGHVILTLAAQDDRPITLSTALGSSLGLASWCNRPPPQQLTARLQLTPVEHASAPLPTGYKAACMGAAAQLTLGPLTEPTAPTGGISEAQAIALAHQDNSLQTFESATAGAFADLNIEPQNTGPGIGVKPDQLVWAVKFAGDMTICPPSPGAACMSPRPGIQVVYLDYHTGAYLLVEGSSPSP